MSTACGTSPRRVDRGLGLALALTLLGVGVLGCSNEPLGPFDLCWEMATRCGGDHVENWRAWCYSECVPESARTYRCADNAQCVLCARDDIDSDAGEFTGRTLTYFGLPNELEFLWTQLLPETSTESEYPASEPEPTGSAFDDRGADWTASTDGSFVGSWSVLEPIHASLGDPGAYFCEPGPNLYLRQNVSGGDAVAMRALSLPEQHLDLSCPDPFCRSGPYAACDALDAAVCPYGDEPEALGYGTGAQLDRSLAPGSSEQATYGYGRYRATFRAGGASAGPVSGTVYAFFSQSNVPCADGQPETQVNTAEIDIELSASTDGMSGLRSYCDPSQMCFIVSTWTSSHQSLPPGTGAERHQVSGFRFYDRETANRLRTYGYDWRRSDVRFAYDADPADCDEHAGECAPSHAATAICQHTHFVPRRPSPLHFQLWNSWWGGFDAPGTPSEMTVTEVWHEPQPPPSE